MLFLSSLNHYLIACKSLQWDSNLGLESFKQLRNTMRTENCRKRLENLNIYISRTSIFWISKFMVKPSIYVRSYGQRPLQISTKQFE